MNTELDAARVAAVNAQRAIADAYAAARQRDPASNMASVADRIAQLADAIGARGPRS